MGHISGKTAGISSWPSQELWEEGQKAPPPGLSVGPMLTFPGNTVPTDGEMVIGELGGNKNSKDVGPTGVASSEPI